MSGPGRRRRLLFVDAIRSDIKSGGATATRALQATWPAGTDVHRLSLAPDLGTGASRWRVAAFACASFPAPLFIALHRATGWIALEFLSRLSFWYVVKCFLARVRFRPDEVVFNHHATLPFLPVFAGLPRTIVWHDLPSQKRDSRDTRAHRRSHAAICAETLAIGSTQRQLTYSNDDYRVLRRFYHARAELVPALVPVETPRRAARDRTTLLLVGNWSRIENTGGVETFFRLWQDRQERREREGRPGRGDPSETPFTFHFLGTGAGAFVQRLRAGLASGSGGAVALRETSSYGQLSDFGALALLAPIERGGGIKLKTLEAWQAGLPVLGTRQAFTGLRPEVWRRGSLRFESMEALVDFCLDTRNAARACDALSPSGAHDAYIDHVTPSTTPE